MEDINRRSFLVGAGQVVGAACLVPVLSLEPIPLKKEVIHFEPSMDWITCEVKMVSVGEVEYRKPICPPNFNPFNYKITLENDLIGVTDISSGQTFHHICPWSTPRISLDMTLHYDSIVRKLEKYFWDGTSQMQIALNVGRNEQMVGNFYISEFNLSGQHI